MTAGAALEEALEASLVRLRDEDFLGQLLERRGRAAELAMEAGEAKLDWVDQLAWALERQETLRAVEEVAAGLAAAGCRHLVWAGMGGSVGIVHALAALGLFDGSPIIVHPLDSTDPAALNSLLDAIAGDGDLAAGLRGAAMVGVSMGMTSEEPITHLDWFASLLREAGLAEPGRRLLVMTLPGSYLDAFAAANATLRLPLQPDGGAGMAGRMSAPASSVFLLPAALALLPDRGRLEEVAEACVAETRLRPGLEPAERAALTFDDPYLRLAAWLDANLAAGRDALLLDLPERLAGLAPWVEQVVEESLGKDGRGLLVFAGQDLEAAAGWPDRYCVLTVDEGSGRRPAGRPAFQLDLGLSGSSNLAGRLAQVARFCAGWNLAVAALGYLRGIPFAGQPAVEAYKRYARELRDAPGPLPYPGSAPSADGGGLELHASSIEASGLPPGRLEERAAELGGGPSGLLAAAISILRQNGRLGYLDVTYNGDPPAPVWERLGAEARALANGELGIPVKLRLGPRAYHSTEQSEVDGPPGVLSLRLLPLRTEPVRLGAYDHRYLHAQALGTVRAMEDAGRPVLLATCASAADAEAFATLLAEAGRRLDAAPA